MKRKSIFFLVKAVVVVGLLLLVMISAWIGFTVANTCKTAQLFYQTSDCVVALTNQLDDKNQPFGKRNDAIWALGQLGDARALATLESHYTGNIPEREPWDEVVSQYELKKAIHLLKGGFNITVLFRPLSLIWVQK